MQSERAFKNRRDAKIAEKQQGIERSNWSQFSDNYSGSWNWSASASIAPLRFIEARLNCMITVKHGGEFAPGQLESLP
ncbi:MAG: hypothetical protein NT154_21210 [Verrucomicrobia bacterium]|nr:hypothetical protein [Verrucomicrobiota bacterium]